MNSRCDSGSAQCAASLSHLLLGQQFAKLFLITRNGVKAVVHFGKRIAHGFLIGVQRLITLRLGDIHLRIQRLAVQQRARILPPALQSCNGPSSRPERVRS